MIVQRLVEFGEKLHKDLSGYGSVVLDDSHEGQQHILEVDLDVWELTHSVLAVETYLLLKAFSLPVEEGLVLHFPDFVLLLQVHGHAALRDVPDALALGLLGFVHILVLCKELG